jgi:hypothetical protein
MARGRGLLTQRAGVGRPLPEAARDHIADDRADVCLFRCRVAGSGIVARNGQRPRAFLRLEGFEEVRGIFDIARRVEHFAQGVKVGAVKMVIDLHAADVDEFRARPFACSNRAIASARFVECTAWPSTFIS